MSVMIRRASTARKNLVNLVSLMRWPLVMCRFALYFVMTFLAILAAMK